MHDRGAIAESPEWIAEFEAAARRPLRKRLRYAFIHTYKPVLDDARYRSTQDADLFVEKSESNGLAVAQALRELGFGLTDAQADEIRRGKDFVQLKNGPPSGTTG
jgi:hypothetical protein